MQKRLLCKCGYLQLHKQTLLEPLSTLAVKLSDLSKLQEQHNQKARSWQHSSKNPAEMHELQAWVNYLHRPWKSAAFNLRRENVNNGNILKNDAFVQTAISVLVPPWCSGGNAANVWNTLRTNDKVKTFYCSLIAVYDTCWKSSTCTGQQTCLFKA